MKYSKKKVQFKKCGDIACSNRKKQREDQLSTKMNTYAWIFIREHKEDKNKLPRPIDRSNAQRVYTWTKKKIVLVFSNNWQRRNQTQTRNIKKKWMKYQFCRFTGPISS